MSGYHGLSNEFELWDRETDSVIFHTTEEEDMVEVIRLALDVRPDKVDNLYLIVYNVYHGRRDEDEWDIHAEGAEELDEWVSKRE